MNLTLSPPPRRIPALALSALAQLLMLLALKTALQRVDGPETPAQTVVVRAIMPLPTEPETAKPSPAPAAVAKLPIAPPKTSHRAPGKPTAPAAIAQGKAEASAAAPHITLEGWKKKLRDSIPEDLNAKPLPPDPAKEKLAQAISRAEKPNCATAYAGGGLLAIPMIAYKALDKDNGCKW